MIALNLNWKFQFELIMILSINNICSIHCFYASFVQWKGQEIKMNLVAMSSSKIMLSEILKGWKFLGEMSELSFTSEYVQEEPKSTCNTRNQRHYPKLLMACQKDSKTNSNWLPWHKGGHFVHEDIILMNWNIPNIAKYMSVCKHW